MNRLQHFTVALAGKLASLSLAILIATNTATADWPQWRGPGRTGVAPGTEALAATWPDDGPIRLWDSEPIPSRDDGGLGSAVISGRHAYLFVVWAKNVPVKQRIITTKALRSLGWPAKQLPDALSAKVEASRKAVNPRALRGNAGKTWAENWIKSNMTEQEKEQFGNMVERRLRDGPEGLDLELLEQLAAVKDKPFADQHSLDQFLAKLKIDDRILQTILKQIPPTRKVANDVVICLELQTGKTVWKKEFPGLPHGPRASSTPCIKNGRLYVAGSTHAYCLDASDGKMIWKTPLTAKGIASSFAVADGIAVTLADSLIAFDIESGKQLWEQKEVRGRNSSPTIWKHQQTTYVLCNSSKQHVACVELKTGKLMWTAPGGGDSSCVVSGDHLIVASKGEKLGLMAYRLTPDKAVKLWSHPLTGQRCASSPMVKDGYVYFLGSQTHLCVQLSTGKKTWQNRSKGEIASPLIADEKIYTLGSNGNELLMLGASPKEYQILGKTKIGAARCPSPAISGRFLIVRMQDRLRCFDLSASSVKKEAPN